VNGTVNIQTDTKGFSMNASLLRLCCWIL